METVCQLINAEEYSAALVRLWHLAKQPATGGGTLLDQWAQCPLDEVADRRIKQHFKSGKSPLSLQAIEARPTQVIEALDQQIDARRGKKAAFTPIETEGETYFLILGSSHNGIDHKQAIRFGNYMHRHLVVPARLFHNVNASLSQLVERAPFSHKHLAQLRQAHEPTLRIALGHFPDSLQIAWSTVATHETRKIGFATGTEGEEERLEAARQQIYEAEQQHADLLIFPELTLSESVQEKLRDWLLQRDEQKNPCSISLIVLGSFHVRSETFARNRSRLLQGKNGRNIFNHDKFSPASIGGFTENFTPGQSAQLLSTPIGNFSLAICKDCIDNYWDIWLKQLCPDWLLIPSLSDKVTLHQQATKNLWNHHRSTSLIANQPIDPDTLKKASSKEAPHFGYIHASESATIDALNPQAYHPGKSALWVMEIAIPAYKIKQC